MSNYESENTVGMGGMREEEIISQLNPMQKKAVTHGEGPLLILAGAGSGKTRVITHRIAWLVTHGVHPAEILAITFTNKAAQEMKERLSGLLGNVAHHMWVGTFHGMMLRILRRHAQVLGFTPSFTILDTDEQQSLLKRLMKEAGINDKLLAPREVLGKISSAKSRLITPEEMMREAEKEIFKAEIAKLYVAYQNALKEGNNMDFDDILVYAVRLLEENPDILSYYQDRFRHVLVDEYQDTNHAQYRLVLLLSDKHKNLCVVGDDDQSIYSFRGANLQNILDFEKDFSSCEIIKLEQNYRSTASILNAANAVISNNIERKSKKLWTDAGEGEKILFYRAGDQYDEARWVAREIRRLSRTRSNTFPFSEVAVLYRINALSRNIEFALREEGIPYKIYGGLRFYDRKEIRDTLAYLRLVDSPDDPLAFTRVINTPRRGIGQTTVERVRAISDNEGLPLSEVLSRAHEFDELSRAASRLQGFKTLIDEMRELRDRNEITFPELIEAVQTRSGLIAELEEEIEKGSEEAVSRLENLFELRSDAMEFADRSREEILQLEELSVQYGDSPYSGDLLENAESLREGELSLLHLTRSFLERSSLYSDLDTEEESETVSLMTVHSAKGLEFKAVFLIGAEEEIFPGMRAMYSPDELEEERRLAYVAITRAKRRLHLTASRNRLLYGRTKYGQVSRFLAEIPDELIDEIGGSRHGDGETYTQAERAEIADKWVERRAELSSVKSGENRFNKPRVKQQPRETDRSQKEALMVLPVGTRLKHPRFGSGTLVKKEEVSGDAILSIDFNGTVKHMMAGMAKLEVE